MNFMSCVTLRRERSGDNDGNFSEKRFREDEEDRAWNRISRSPQHPVYLSGDAEAQDCSRDLRGSLGSESAECGTCISWSDLIVNLSASDEVVGKDSYRRSLVSAQSARLLCGYIYATAGEGESTTGCCLMADRI